MKRIQTDILISGGGIAGLAAASAFGSAGFSVLCVDPAPPVTDEAAQGADLRTTAFLQPAQRLLEAAGLWARLAPHASELRTMRIVEAGGKNPHVTDFCSGDISDRPFGWNLPNWLLRREMLARIGDLETVIFKPGTATGRVTTRTGTAIVALSDGTQVATGLLIAADGRNSGIRGQAGIGVTTWRYGQKALAFSVTHPVAHRNVSTEIHLAGGPFTLVPMPDLMGQPRSAVVWMDRGPGIAKLMAMDEADFEAEMAERSAHLFGPLALVGRRTVWPIISQLADRLTAQRTALIAEAAHVVPPIGAQGLNMSLADIRALLDLASADPSDIGSETMLSAYQRARWRDVEMRVRGIDLLNRASMAGGPIWRELRRAGLESLHAVAPLRRTLMRTGLGAT
ncbi:MAG: UbiH/UbiF family hydroxylase [Paracoccaceae bacterium]